MPYSAISPRRAKDVVNLAPSAAKRTSHTRAAAVDRGDDGLAQRRHEVRMPRADQLADVGPSGGVDGRIADRVQIPHVRARAEGATLAGHHDGPDGGIGLRVVET